MISTSPKWLIVLSTYLNIILLGTTTLISKSHGFAVNRPVRGSSSSISFGNSITIGTISISGSGSGSTTALYAKKKKTKTAKKKKTTAAAEAAAVDDDDDDDNDDTDTPPPTTVSAQKTKKKKAATKKKKTKQATDSGVVVMTTDTDKETEGRKAPIPEPRDEPPPPPVPEQPIVISALQTVVAKDAEPIVKISSTKKREKVMLYDENGVYLGPQVTPPDTIDFDLTGGRPQVIIETREMAEQKKILMEELESGKRILPAWCDEYGVLEDELLAEYDNNDPDAIDADSLGVYDYTDFEAKFENEFDLEKGDADPNLITDTTGFLKENPKDEEGIEVGYDPYFGPSNPIDTRTITGYAESYMINEISRNETLLTPDFYPDDPEIEFNKDFIKLRKTMDIIETYVDDFLPEDMPVPKRAAKWHGYPEKLSYPAKNYTNNRFTKYGDLTNFDEMTPFRARQRAVELARATNAEWLPNGVSQEYHRKERQPYENYGTLVGTLRKGECDPEIVEKIQPALHILGSCAKLLSIEHGTVFRFHYHGLMKNKFGMQCWTETLIRDCGAEVTGVVFETGFRKRDPAYDGGSKYFGFNSGTIGGYE